MRILLLRVFQKGLLSSLCILGLTGCAVQGGSSKVRVACIGDSLTYGDQVEKREQNSYPAQLQRLLGSGYQVENYGVNAHTMQHQGDYPYWEHPFFQESADFAPDIVLLMLGTNDSKNMNWSDLETYLADTREIIAHFASLPAKPQVYLMTPPTLYIRHSAADAALPTAMSAERVDEMAEALRQIAREQELPLIDIHAATAGRPELFPVDGVHTSATGAAVIAETVYAALQEARK